MSLWNELLERAAPLLVEGAKSVADNFVDAQTLTKDQKQAMYTAYYVINVWGDDLVESSENEYDDVLLAGLSSFIEDTFDEAGIELHPVPEELEVEPEQPAEDGGGE